MNQHEPQSVDGDMNVVEARAQFRAALMHTHTTRRDIGEVDIAAGRFCLLMRQAGHTPQRALIDAKAVIDESIDGDDAMLAERAITRCIEHYFRD